jgi:hypothetical protein
MVQRSARELRNENRLPAEAAGVTWLTEPAPVGPGALR